MTSNENTDLRNPSYAWVMVFASFVLSALAFGSLASISNLFLKNLAGLGEKFLWHIRLLHLHRQLSAYIGVTLQTNTEQGFLDL